ncbi:MAG TPA: tryptophan 2,3-dioxygenase family protein [Planctomycetota bacterium]|nr:tryptophan 2,3-dioxygenase family protein [Planctomycetota bacterium]
MPGRAPTYGSYLQLDLLLAAQNPPDYERLEPSEAPSARTRPLLHHDELLFIVVHQAYELWFKLILHELSRARDLLGRVAPHKPTTVDERDVPEIVHTLERVNEVLRLAVDQFGVIETMTPLSFLAFRDAITPASGFQSVQFREVEILLGADEARRAVAQGVFDGLLSRGEAERLRARLDETTLKDALLDWLGRTPIRRAYPEFAAEFAAAFDAYCDDQARRHAANPYAPPSERTAAAERARAAKAAARAYVLEGDPIAVRANQAFLFITTYREEPLLRWPALLLDRLVEFEQRFRAFRFRHARMVERMIGARTGTGGSSGVDYLDRGSQQRIFGNLLEARNFLLDRARLRDLPHPEVFRFRFEG